MRQKTTQQNKQRPQPSRALWVPCVRPHQERNRKSADMPQQELASCRFIYIMMCLTNQTSCLALLCTSRRTAGDYWPAEALRKCLLEKVAAWRQSLREVKRSKGLFWVCLLHSWGQISSNYSGSIYMTSIIFNRFKWVSHWNMYIDNYLANVVY